MQSDQQRLVVLDVAFQLMEFLLVLSRWWFAHLVSRGWFVFQTCMTRTWEDHGHGCLQRVCVDISLCELWPVLLIEVVPECLAGSDVSTCSASVAVPFEVHPDCGLKHESQLDSRRSVLLDCLGCQCACIKWLASH